MEKPKLIFIALLVISHFVISTLLTLAGLKNRLLWALAGMLWGVNIFWIGGVGLVSILAKDRARHLFAQLPGPATVKAVLFMTILALIEEAITTAMTNSAPLFGVALGEVYITASADYLDVILYHSVVVFIPQFIAWAWLLSRYSFSPFQAFLLYGLTGFINETLSFGLNLLTLPQWILVYGLMIYLPAYCFPKRPDRRPARWWPCALAIILPIFAALPVVALLLFLLAPGHPKVHFPPFGS